jgi:hypothetical protein
MRKKVYIADVAPGLIELMVALLKDTGYEAAGSTELLDLIVIDTSNLPMSFY